VTHLRKMMLEELQRLNYSEGTTRFYIRVVEDFARRFNCPPDRLGHLSCSPTPSWPSTPLSPLIQSPSGPASAAATGGFLLTP
jgi:hypothetical protein